MSYVDGFVIPVPLAQKDAYIKLARESAPIYLEYGALKVVECWGDDVPEGKVTSFPMAVKCEADETVVFSWIIWPDRQTRDAGNAKVMADPRMAGDNMPFDGKRLIWGGFNVISEA